MKPSRLLVPLVLAVSLSACSKREKPAVVTLPENAPTTSVPSTLAPDPDSQVDSGEPPSPPPIEWVAQVGGAGEDVFYGVTGASPIPEQIPEGEEATGSDVVAVGSTDQGIESPPTGATDVLTARIAADGELRSHKVSGSASVDVATSAATAYGPVDSNGAALTAPIACGYTNGDFTGQAFGLLDGWCGPVALDEPAGKTPPLFGAAMTPFAAESNEVISSVAITHPEDDQALAAEQNMFIAGSTDGMYPGAGDSTGRGLGQGDVLAFRTSLSRGTSWIRQFGTPNPDAATGVCTVGGNGYFVGWTEGDLGGRSAGGRDAWISMIDRSGMQRWLIQFGYAANEEFRAVAAGGDPAKGTQQFVAVGVTDGDGPQPSHGGKDALVSAFAPDGSTLWSIQIGAELDDEASAVTVTDTTIYVAGTTTSAPATEAGPEVPGLGDLDDSIGAGGSKDGFLTAIDAATGSVLWTTRFGSEADEVVTSMTVTDSGLLAIAGSTTGSLGENTTAGGRDGFVVAYRLPAAGGGAQSWV